MSLFLLSSCKEDYHYPNYKIIKPTKKYEANRKNIQKILNSYLDKPYVWAEEGPHAFDCSGLTYNIYGSMGIEIPRVAREQAKMGKRIAYKDLHYGDLVFFGSRSKRSKRINHVGMYLENHYFAHASSKNRKVIISRFEENGKYVKRIKVCRRYLSKDAQRYYQHSEQPLDKMSTTSTFFTTPWQKGMPLPIKAVP